MSFARTAGSGYLLQPSASDLGSTALTVRIKVTGQVVTLVPGVNWTVSQVVPAPVERFTTP